jgi:RimJ/RimL family protein N-acetyltransferase
MSEPQQKFSDFNCPYCGKKVSFPASWAGSVQQCPWCIYEFVMPYGHTEPAREIKLDIRTPRLLFRRLIEKDRNDLLQIVSDKETLLYLAWRIMDREDVEKWLVSDAGFRLIEVGSYAYFGIELKATSKLIGIVEYNYYDAEWRNAGFNVVVNRAVWNQGYGTEAVRGVMTFAFKDMNVRRLLAQCDSRNTGGLKMLGKAGMRYEGERVENQLVKNEWINTVSFAVLQREWQAGLSKP